MLDVVAFAPAGGRVASRALAVPIPGDECFPDRGWHGAPSPADVEHLGGPVGDDAADVAVAGQALERGSRQPRDMVGVGPHLGNQIAVATAFELVAIHDRADGGPVPL